jgi:hypothetical protein
LDTSQKQASLQTQFISFKKSASQPQNISNNNTTTPNIRKNSADLSISYQVPQIQTQKPINYVNNYQLNKQQQNEILNSEQPIYDPLFSNNNTTTSNNNNNNTNNDDLFKNTNNNQQSDNNFFFHASHIRKIHNSIPDIILTCPGNS